MIFSGFLNSKSTFVKQRQLIILMIYFLIFLLLPQSLLAKDSPQITVRGFGTFGASTLTKTNRYLDFLKEEDEGTYFSPSTKLGINLTSNLQENSRIVVQAIMLGSQDNAEPQLDLAFVARQIPSLDLELVIGRVVAPIWLFSEEQSVGYNYVWVRPPTELYNTAPIRNLDGFGFRYSPKVSVGDLLVQAFYGQSTYSDTSQRLGPNGAGGLTDVLSESSTSMTEALSSEIRYQISSALLLRAGYNQANISPRNLLTTSGTPASIALTISKKEMAELSSVGFSGEWNGFQYSAEMAKIKVALTSIKNFEGGYVTLGYKYKNFLGYASSSEQSHLLGNFYIVNTDPLAAARVTETKSMSYGLNYYGFEDMVLKFAVAKYDEKFNQVITYTTEDNNQFDLYSLTFDFIF